MNKLLICFSLFTLACTLTTVPPTAFQRTDGVIGADATASPQEMTVCGSWGLHVRTGPGVEYPLAQEAVLTDGTRVVMVETMYDQYGYRWLRVTFDGGAGVVYARYLCE